jgi:hypothetical protein
MRKHKCEAIAGINLAGIGVCVDSDVDTPCKIEARGRIAYGNGASPIKSEYSLVRTLNHSHTDFP